MGDQLKNKADLTVEIGKRIRKIREEKKLSIRELEYGDHSMDRHQISRLENGEFTPTIYTLYKLSKALNTPLSDFFLDLD